MSGIALPGGVTMYGEESDSPGLCGGVGGTGLTLPGGATLWGKSVCVEDPPNPLTDAALLLLASNIDPDDYETGDPWPNAGTTGAALDAEPNTADGTLPPDFANGGFVLTDPNQGWVIPDNASINATADESFTLMVEVEVQHIPTTGQSLIYAGKRDGGTLTGTGWSMTDWNIIAPLIIDGAGVTLSQPTGPTIVHTREGWQVYGRRLGVFRLDRESGEGTWWVDNDLRLTVDCSEVGDLTSANTLVFGTNGLSTVQYGIAYWGRALTDLEITQGLPHWLDQ